MTVNNLSVTGQPTLAGWINHDDAGFYSNIYDFLSFLPEQDLKSVRLVSKHFYKSADHPHFYHPEDLKVKNAYREYLETEKGFTNAKTELIRLIQKSHKLFNSIDLTRNKLNWKKENSFDRIAWRLESSPRILLLLQVIFPQLFTKFEKSITKQKRLKQLEIDLSELLVASNSLNKEREHLEATLRKKQNAVNFRISSFNRQLAKWRPDVTIFSLFGGKSEYEALPIFDFANTFKKNAIIDSLDPNKMTAPIMRGTDHYGRLFFIIRWKSKKDNKVSAHFFFSRSAKSTGSGDGGATIPREFVIKTSGFKDEAYEELRKLIQNKRYEDLIVQ